MKHFHALSQKEVGGNFAPIEPCDHPFCDGELVHLYNGFWGDVNWEVVGCLKCHDILALVEGRIHWWNYTITEPKPETLEKANAIFAQS